MLNAFRSDTYPSFPLDRPSAVLDSLHIVSASVYICFEIPHQVGFLSSRIRIIFDHFSFGFSRLSARNMLNLRRLVMFLDALQKYAVEWKEKNTKSNGSKAEVMTAAELVDRLGRKASGVNLLEIEGYLKRSKVKIRQILLLVDPFRVI
jgi:chromosome transmission fidelity protein 1